MGEYSTDAIARRVTRLWFFDQAVLEVPELALLRFEWRELRRLARQPARPWPTQLAGLLNGEAPHRIRPRLDWWPIQSFQELRALARRTDSPNPTTRCAAALAAEMVRCIGVGAERWGMSAEWVEAWWTHIAFNGIELQAPKCPFPLARFLTREGPRWNPLVQERVRFQRAVRRMTGWREHLRRYGKENLQARLDEYCDRVERRAQRAGLTKVRRDCEITHFRLFARFWLKGEKLKHIANTSDRQMAAVSAAVKRAEELLGLEPRHRERPGFSKEARARKEVHSGQPSGAKSEIDP